MLLAPPVEVAATVALSPAEIDAEFQHALRLIELGQALVAVPILKRLYDQTRAPRIRLELARALWLTDLKDEARSLFVEAFKDAPPSVVKANILGYINSIDRQKGKFTLTASVARYDNPLQQPGAYTLNFAGIDLTFEPDAAYRKQWGINLGGEYAKALQSGWHIAASAGYRELPGDLADRLSADFSLSRQLKTMPLEVKFGATRLNQKGQSFTLPYSQAGYLIQLSDNHAIRPTVTLGYYAADTGRPGSGVQFDAFIPYIHAPRPTSFFALGPTYLEHNAGYAEQAYASLGVRGLGTIQSDTINVELGVQGTITRFKGIDPFWGLRRIDRGLFASVVVSSYRVRVGSLVPALGLNCSVNSSTVAYYQQRGCDTQFELRKIF